ncbi:MAG TPA: hypothetical protein VMX18_02165 [Candidatus Bipolaricaulota bacterium]|nr:hypothetical protein [Candidatus Bipolaricaulota bacterium]
MAKYLIVLGAGASYGSDKPANTPPLTNKLFDELCKSNPEGWGSLDGKYKKLFRQDFEQAMEQVAKEQPQNMTILQRAMAYYFYKFEPYCSNLYYQLAKKIKKTTWDGAFVSFNYERLLELSLSRVGFQPYIGNKPKNSNNLIELCLPHGYCDIFCTAVKAGSTTIFSGCNVDGPVKKTKTEEEFEGEIKNSVPPVMSYFVPSKVTMSGTSFINQQRNRFKELTQTSSVIVIIGMRIRKHDEHIWDPLSSTSAKIIYCAGTSAGEEFKVWAEKNRKGKEDIMLQLYFRNNFKQICFHLGII